MKTVILALTFVLYFALPLNSQTQISRTDKSRTESRYNSNRIIYSHTYEYVFKDGMWWIYEYDEDGGLINMYPLDD
ncbi:MAG: hypothetical protein IPM38_16830 [Ignavibacteria bacterium]|nr:hypothetical protein [Ignavibacteria bacterium]